jgi:hypothetical protein
MSSFTSSFTTSIAKQPTLYPTLWSASLKTHSHRVKHMVKLQKHGSLPCSWSCSWSCFLTNSSTGEAELCQTGPIYHNLYRTIPCRFVDLFLTCFVSLECYFFSYRYVEKRRICLLRNKYNITINWGRENHGMMSSSYHDMLLNLWTKIIAYHSHVHLDRTRLIHLLVTWYCDLFIWCWCFSSPFSTQI